MHFSLMSKKNLLAVEKSYGNYWLRIHINTTHWARNNQFWNVALAAITGSTLLVTNIQRGGGGGGGGGGGLASAELHCTGGGGGGLSFSWITLHGTETPINILRRRDKMAAFFQTIFLNGFSWMKMYGFRLEFHWSLFLRFQLTIFQHWFR